MNTSTALNKKMIISREAFIAGIAAFFIAIVMITGCSSAKSKVVGSWHGEKIDDGTNLSLSLGLASDGTGIYNINSNYSSTSSMQSGDVTWELKDNTYVVTFDSGIRMTFQLSEDGSTMTDDSIGLTLTKF